MSKRPPDWQRKGHQSEKDYKAACAAKRRTQKAALAFTGAKHSTARILERMWLDAEFDKPEVTITKEQLMSRMNCSLGTVRTAWRFLRAERSIVPIRGVKGGNSVPTTFKLGVAGHKVTPSEAHVAGKINRDDREAAFRFLAQKHGGIKATEMLGPKDEDQE